MNNIQFSKIAITIILALTVMACSKEEKTSIEISKTAIELLNDESAIQLAVTSNVDWVASLNGDKEGIQCTPSSGKSGTTQISVKASPNTKAQIRNAGLAITGGGKTITAKITQAPLSFAVSPQSLLFNPEDTSHELAITADVNWEITNKNWPEWISITPLSGKGNENIQIKVTDNDKRKEVSFTLSIQCWGQLLSIPVKIKPSNDANKYNDGGYTVYQTSKKAKPIKLIITGDGYLSSHFNYGGLFDQNADEAIEALFSIEPYKTYREYFSVYKIAAYSKETGISSEVANIQKNTAFSCTLTGGTGIEADYDKVFAYATRPTEITESDLTNTSVCVIINANTYAGTCYTVSNGKSIAMVPVSHPRESFYSIEFPNIIRHEFGGHGFGRLADEYLVHEAPIPQENEENLLLWQKYNYFKNVSPFYTKEKVPWSRFIEKPEYPQVGIFEGGYLYTQGITRSEEISCMDDNRPYYNTQSRYLIVERILKATGEGTLTYQQFVEKDVQKTPPPFTRNIRKPKDFKPLAPPILVME